MISGNIYLKERDNLLWIKNFEKPINAAVSDNGRVVLLHNRQTDSLKLSSSSNQKEITDLGGTLTAFENDGQQIFTYDFDSNIEGCSISSEGKLVSVSTLSPDNSIYCFDLQNKTLLWKYKNHSRKVVVKLQFNKNNIVVFTGNSISTAEKEYVMQLDGNLEPSYAEIVNNLNKIKKQSPDQKTESIIAMVDSGERDKIIEGITLLKTFVTTKGSFPYHSKIIETLSKFIQTEDNGIFDNLWIVLKGIIKNQPQVIEPFIPKILSRFKKHSKEDFVITFRYLGDLGKVNPQWIKNEIPLIKQKFVSSKNWNERISAAFAIGSIGSADVNSVKELIPIMVEYISNLGRIINEINSIAKNNIQNSADISVVNSSNIESVNWLRDACIDVIGQIGKKYPESIKMAIPVLERLSNYAISPYTNKKAKKTLKGIYGK